MRIPPYCLIAGERSTLYAMSERKIRDVAAEEREADAERIARDAEHVAAAGQGETAAACASSPDLHVSHGGQPARPSGAGHG